MRKPEAAGSRRLERHSELRHFFTPLEDDVANSVNASCRPSTKCRCNTSKSQLVNAPPPRKNEPSELVCGAGAGGNRNRGRYDIWDMGPGWPPPDPKGTSPHDHTVDACRRITDSCSMSSRRRNAHYRLLLAAARLSKEALQGPSYSKGT